MKKEIKIKDEKFILRGGGGFYTLTPIKYPSKFDYLDGVCGHSSEQAAIRYAEKVMGGWRPWK